jgi:hypothetical protein
VNDPQADAMGQGGVRRPEATKPLAAHGGTLEQALSRIPTDPAAFAEWKQRRTPTSCSSMNQQLAPRRNGAPHAATEGQAGATLAESKRYHDAMIGTPPNSNDPDFQAQINYWAEVVRKGGALPPGLARGPGGGAFVREVTKRAAVGDVSPEDMMANQARFGGEKAGQRTLGTRTANIEMAATEAASLADLAKQASAKVDRTQYKAFNDVMQAGQRATSSPELRAFTASNTSLINAYARAINPQGVGTVADKEHAREMLSTAFSKGDYEAAIDQLMLEIDAARKSPGTVQKEMRDRFTGKEQPASARRAAQGGERRHQVPRLGEVSAVARSRSGRPGREARRAGGTTPQQVEAFVFEKLNARWPPGAARSAQCIGAARPWLRGRAAGREAGRHHDRREGRRARCSARRR